MNILCPFCFNLQPLKAINKVLKCNNDNCNGAYMVIEGIPYEHYGPHEKFGITTEDRHRIFEKLKNDDLYESIPKKAGDRSTILYTKKDFIEITDDTTISFAIKTGTNVIVTDKENRLIISVIKLKHHENTLFFHATTLENHKKILKSEKILPTSVSKSTSTEGFTSENDIFYIALNKSTAEEILTRRSVDSDKIITGSFSGYVMLFPYLPYAREVTVQIMSKLPSQICGIQYHEANDNYYSIVIKYGREYKLKINKKENVLNKLFRIILKKT